MLHEFELRTFRPHNRSSRDVAIGQRAQAQFLDWALADRLSMRYQSILDREPTQILQAQFYPLLRRSDTQDTSLMPVGIPAWCMLVGSTRLVPNFNQTCIANRAQGRLPIFCSPKRSLFAVLTASSGSTRKKDGERTTSSFL